MSLRADDYEPMTTRFLKNCVVQLGARFLNNFMVHSDEYTDPIQVEESGSVIVHDVNGRPLLSVVCHCAVLLLYFSKFNCELKMQKISIMITNPCISFKRVTHQKYKYW